MLKYFILFSVLVFVCPEMALAIDEAVPATPPSWIEWLLNRIPAETIMWVVAFVGLLNGISEGLGKLEEAITKYSEKTPTEADDKIAAVLHVVVTSLKKFAGFAKMIVDFFTAKAKKK